MTRIGREACANQPRRRHQSFFASLLVYSNISEEEKAVRGVPKFKNFFETHFESSELLIKLI